jgi:hypothetical protein
MPARRLAPLRPRVRFLPPSSDSDGGCRWHVHRRVDRRNRGEMQPSQCGDNGLVMPSRQLESSASHG